MPAGLSQLKQLMEEYFDNKTASFLIPLNPKGVLGILCMFRLRILSMALNWGMNKDIIYGMKKWLLSTPQSWYGS